MGLCKGVYRDCIELRDVSPASGESNRTSNGK